MSSHYQASTFLTKLYHRCIKFTLLLSLLTSVLSVKALASVDENVAENDFQIWEGFANRPATEALSGRLTITINSKMLYATLGAYQAQAELKDNKFTLSFTDETNELGEFVGYVNANSEIYGHWLQPSLSILASTKYATPVRFTRQGNSYSGQVKPLQDRIHVYLSAKYKSEDRYSLAVFVPQHNGGRYFHNTELVFDENRVSIVRHNEKENKETLITNGLFNAEKQTITFYFPYWGGLYTFEKVAQKDHFLLPKTKALLYSKPAKLADGWEVADAEDYELSSEALVAFANEQIVNPAPSARDPQLEAFLVARQGKLVYEQYFRGKRQNEPHDLRSASKSLTGLLPGLVEYAQTHYAYPNAIPLASTNARANMLERRVYETMGHSAIEPGKKEIKLEDLLNMSSGLDCDDNGRESPGNENTMQNQQAQKDWQTFILDLLLIHPPSEHTAYCSGGISLGGAMASRITGRSVPLIIDDLFARPLGINHYHINMQADGEKAYNGGGLRLTARDLLKMGQLLLNKGKWNGKQLLSQEYVKKVMTPQVEMFDNKYSLGWWTRDYNVDGKIYRTHYASGNGGQHVFIVPELDLAVVYLNSAFNARGGRTAREDWFPNVVLKQVLKPSN